MIYRVFDIETIADSDLWKPPAEEPDKFPPLCACRIVAVAWADIELAPAPGTQVVTVRDLRVMYSADSEAGILRRWSNLCATGRPVLVSWNGRRFDGPAMAVRAMKHQIPWLWYYQQQPNYRYRYGEAHLDLADSMTDYAGGMMKLSDVARMCGLEGKTIMDGGGVADAAARGEHESIARYCVDDVFMTAVIFARFQALRGVISPDAVKLVESELSIRRRDPAVLEKVT